VPEPNSDTLLGGKLAGINGVQIGPGATPFTLTFVNKNIPPFKSRMSVLILNHSLILEFEFQSC